jgi:predicted metal-dependent HD superfamily phosphohydrolase
LKISVLTLHLNTTMELRLLVLLLIAATIHQSFGAIQPLVQDGDSKLAKTVCRVVYDIKRKEPEKRSVAIARMNNQIEPGIIDDIVECMPKTEVTMKIMNIEGGQVKANDASVVVLLADELRKVRKILFFNCFKFYIVFNVLI